MKQIENLIINSSIKLFSLNDELANKKNDGKLIFPMKNEPKKFKKKRISEQEARFIFCNEIELNAINLFYSIETPTINKYSFTGTKEISGNIDVCIYKYENNSFTRKSNIEFKAHNMVKSFKKDFHKLLNENGEMNFFIHILESIDNHTLYSKNIKTNSGMPVINKYLQDIHDLNSKFNLMNTEITIFIISLSPKLIIKKSFNPKLSKFTHNEFSLDYNILKDKVDIKNTNWVNCYGS